MHRFVVAGALLVSGCTYDFDKYEPDGVVTTNDGGVPTNDSGVPTGGCSEAGSRVHGGHCYFPTASPLSWPAAKAACEAAGAHLAAVTTDAEQAGIASMASESDRWIGLSRPAGSALDGRFYTWVTGDPLDYFKWDVREPTGAGECVRMKRGGAWGDSPCASSFIALCEREKL